MCSFENVWKYSLTFQWFFLWNFDFSIIYMNIYQKIHCFVFRNKLPSNHLELRYFKLELIDMLEMRMNFCYVPGEFRLESSKSIETNWFCFFFVMASNIILLQTYACL